MTDNARVRVKCVCSELYVAKPRVIHFIIKTEKNKVSPMYNNSVCITFCLQFITDKAIFFSKSFFF